MLSLERQNQWRAVYRANHPGWRPATELFADRVRHYLRPGARLLDLGCGRGGLVEQLAYPQHHTVGIDPDLASLREHRLPALPRLAGHSDQLPFAAGSFDVVYAAWLLEHLPAPAKTFAAVARALRPGGVFVFITPNLRHPIAWGNFLAGRLGGWQGRLVARLYGRAEGDTFPTVYQANTPAALGRLAAGAGLSLTELWPVADPSYLAFNPLSYQIAQWVDSRLPANRRVHIVGVAQKG